MRLSDLIGIQKASFGGHTKLVHGLASTLARQHAALQRKRVPVLVVVEKDGTFNVYGERNAEVEVVHVPSDWTRRDTLEEWIDTQVSDRHAEIHQSSCWVAKGGKKFCVPLETIYKRLEKQLVSKALDLPIARNRLATTEAKLEASNKECGREA